MNDERHIYEEMEVWIRGVIVWRGVVQVLQYLVDIPPVGEGPRVWRGRVCLRSSSNHHHHNNIVLEIAMPCQSQRLRVIVQKVSQRWTVVGETPGGMNGEDTIVKQMVEAITKIWEDKEIAEVDLDIIIITQQQRSIEKPAAGVGGCENRMGTRVTLIP